MRPTLEVTGVEERPPPAGVRAWRIDHPGQGAKLSHRNLGVAGWIVPAQAPVAAVELSWEERPGAGGRR